MTLANDTPLPNHSKPDFRHVLLPAVLFGLDSKCRGFPGIFPIRWDLRWVALFEFSESHILQILNIFSGTDAVCIIYSRASC